MEKGDPVQQPHSVWLRPAKEVQKMLQDDVQQLCELADAPFFEPHMTLLGDLSGLPRETLSVCKAVFNQSGAIKVKVTGIASTERFFMSLFLDLDVPATLIAALTEVAKQMSVQPPPFRPHISLAYGFTAYDAPARILDHLNEKYVDQVFWLSSFATVASSSATAIEGWKIISEQTFSG